MWACAVHMHVHCDTLSSGKSSFTQQQVQEPLSRRWEDCNRGRGRNPVVSMAQVA